HHAVGRLIRRPGVATGVLPASLPHRAGLRCSHACPHACPYGIGLARLPMVRARTAAPAPHAPPSRPIVAAVLRLKIPQTAEPGAGAPVLLRDARSGRSTRRRCRTCARSEWSADREVDELPARGPGRRA